MQLLVDRGAKLNVRDINGDSPLLICSASGFSEGVRLLLQVTDRLCRHILPFISASVFSWLLLLMTFMSRRSLLSSRLTMLVYASD